MNIINKSPTVLLAVGDFLHIAPYYIIIKLKYIGVIYMKFNQVETTYICQFSKPQNRAMLEGYKARRDKSGAELSRYYKDVLNVLKDTPAYGVSGVNKMLNELTAGVRATLNNEKRGKISAYAHANKLLYQLDYFGNNEAEARYKGRYELAPLLTNEELYRLEALS
jgi:hypothetical protein